MHYPWIFIYPWLLLFVILPFLADRSDPGAVTINSLCEERDCGSPSDRPKDVWISQRERTDWGSDRKLTLSTSLLPPSYSHSPPISAAPPAIKRFLTEKHWGQSYLNNFCDWRRACRSHGKKILLWKKTAMLDNSASVQPGATLLHFADIQFETSFKGLKYDIEIALITCFNLLRVYPSSSPFSCQ